MSVVVMGVGICGSFPTSKGLSYREMIARAATMAYSDAGIEAEELDGAVSVEEDFISGYSIADEYVPDQLGVVRKPVYTICGDFLHGVGSAAMQINTGRYQLLVVEAYCKASNILTKNEILNFAFDPVYNRLGVSPHYLAGIEMQHLLEYSDYHITEVADVVVRNREAAVANPLAPHGMKTRIEDVLDSRPIAEPLSEMMIAKPVDAAVVAVLGTEVIANEKARKPVYLTGTGWCSGNSIIERREHTHSVGTALAADMAYREAKIENPVEDFDIAYVSDLYAHRQLMHLEALQLGVGQTLPVNPDGGSLGMGDLIEGNGGARFYDAVQQIRGEAGSHQVKDAKSVVVQGWRGLPTDSCAVVTLNAERRTA
jgi:acetyl-CoA C-acetyltransferase